VSVEGESTIKSNDPECQDPGLEVGSLVHTACGGVVHYSPAIPCSSLNGQSVYFCLPDCKSDFEKDPFRSCLAIRKPGH
jgi:YHS domain-containing protein